MNVNPLGSSAVLVLAAVLWFLYLIPTWLRRREYLATERNAVRLQQTLRIMAETAQVPQQVHAESSARSVAAHQRILKKEQQVEHSIARAHEALAARAAALRLAQARPIIKAAARTSPDAARRLRRSRAVTSLVLLGALVAAGSGIPAALVGQRRAARDRRPRRGRVARPARPDGAGRPLPPGAGPQAEHRSGRALARSSCRARADGCAGAAGWTPVPLPKPLYLSAPVPAARAAESEEASLEGREREFRELREAAAKAERALREAQIAANVTPIRSEPEAPAAASRFARMGMVDGLDASVTDLDAVLRRRRAVG